MNHLDLFSGIGGFSLAAQWAWGKNHNIISFVEQDKYCQKVLSKHWPSVPIIGDIHDYKHDKTQTVSLITGGFPCQPFSVAGKRKGKEDDRAIWPQMLRIIKESRPTWIISENVIGIINMELANCITDMEDESYEVETFIIPASAVAAPHRRDRVWIIAHAKNDRCEHAIYAQGKEDFGRGVMAQVPIKGIFGFDKQRLYKEICASGFIRKINGIPNRVDRLKRLGNAIVPQVAYEIMKAIKMVAEG